MDTLDRPAPRKGHSCVLFGDSMIIFGGIDNNDNYLNDIYEFHFVRVFDEILMIKNSRSWTKIVSLSSPCQRSFHAATISKSSMYIFGNLSLYE